jgi:hypothetical protein
VVGGCWSAAELHINVVTNSNSMLGTKQQGGNPYGQRLLGVQQWG